MLRSEQALYRHQYHERKEELKMKELEVEIANLRITQSVAALIAGFASALLVGPLLITEGNLFLKELIFGLTLFSISMECYAILVAAICMMKGPDLAYRGQSRNSVSKAVDVLIVERKKVFIAFLLGLSSFFVVMVGMVWVKLGECGPLHSWVSATLMSFFMAIVLSFLLYEIYRLQIHAFKCAPKEEAEEGGYQPPTLANLTEYGDNYCPNPPSVWSARGHRERRSRQNNPSANNSTTSAASSSRHPHIVLAGLVNQQHPVLKSLSEDTPLHSGGDRIVKEILFQR
ncbi:hypothetical protein CYMTET_9490 [Cymbomonas tetramitiformis]|uniref:Uncharacterized protein n=1 Tax=Cymbomonas tetramitiformis TaxID=36881 RepID=A0AAE0GQZ9_9CHLO|nr:hypothetical protein CYMTET_9490 [Cymbomonas tetramitiformis]